MLEPRSRSVLDHPHSQMRNNVDAHSGSLRAQRSNPSSRAKGAMDCFVARAPRNDVQRDAFAFSRHDSPEVFISLSLAKQREQGMPGARCTRGLVCKMHKEMRTRAYRFSGGNPAFPAQWLYGLCLALPGEIRLVTVAAGLRLIEPVELISPPAAWRQQRASGPHGFAVRELARSSCAPCIAHRQSLPCDHLARRRCRVHRIPSRVRDDRDTPLLQGKDGACW